MDDETISEVLDPLALKLLAGEFSEGFTDLHTRVNQETIAGRVYGIEDARPSIELAYRIRTTTPVMPKGDHAHPRVAEGMRR